MEFRILGPLEVRAGAGPVTPAGAKPRALLAMLLLHANEPVSAERLAIALWGEDAAAGAAKTIQVHVSRLRRALDEADVLTTTPAGYRLRVLPGELDADRFEQLAAEGHRALAAGAPERAARVFREALSLWRGPALADVAVEAFAQAEIARLEDERLAALESRVEADLALGRHAELVGELAQLVAAHPLRERLHGQRMLALYRSGRQADALQIYRDARNALVEQLGIEPGPELRELERSILAHDPALDVAPPAPRAPAHATAARMPAPRTPTIGREKDVARLRELLSAGRLVTLVGVGGIGKTRLAVVLARAVSAEYEDGVRFVSLASTESADLVTTTVASAMGVAPLPDEPALDGLVRLIGDKRMLVVLDNFEHVLAAAEVISDLLEACAGLRIVATSREPLRLSGEQVFSVGPLALPEARNGLELASIQRSPAIRLFADRSRARDAGFVLSDENAVAVAETCARLEGIPLAIELAAAHAALLTPEALTKRLDDALAVLVGGPRDAPARQRTLRATLDWSYALLDHNEQEAFAGLAVFSGGCTLEAAESVLRIDLDAVEALLAKSLLVTAAQDGVEPRVRMLEPVRAYALERLEHRSDAEDLRDRHCHYYVSLAERAELALRGPEQISWLRRLDADHANLRAAVRWSLSAKRPELGLRLASALWHHGRAMHSEIRDWLETTLKAATDIEPRLHAKARLATSRIIAGGPGSMEHTRAALQLFRAVGDNHGAARALVALSIEADQAGERATAADLAREALELARTTDDDWLIAWALSAQVLGSPESFQEKRHLAEEALTVLRRVGDRIQLSAALSNLGYSAMMAGDFATAAPLLDEAVAVGEEVQDARLLPFHLVNRGLLHVFQGEDRHAAGDLARALALCRESGQALPVSEGLTGLAVVTVRRGDSKLAARLCGAADAHRLFEAVSVPELQLQQQAIDSARASCEETDWEREFTAGTTLSFDQALSQGLDAAALASNAG